MEVVGVIPARYYSTRFEGKVLADINGKPMIQHIWERAKQSIALDEVIVATEDERVVKAVEAFGGKAVLTSKDHQSGTDRIVETVFSLDVEIVVNIQGDEPLIDCSMIQRLVDAIKTDKDVYMATIAKKMTDEEAISNPNVVKVIMDRNNYAIYFSRSVIPYPRNKEKALYYKHMGLYAYTKDFLFTFTRLRSSMLESAECLEQLRVLESGYKIKVVETLMDTVAVDTPEDLEKVKQIMKNK